MNRRPIVLASASPRRKEALSTLVSEFEIVVSGVDEEALTTDDPVSTAEGLALAKARAVARLRPEATVIGGDTVVAIEGEQLAKPTDSEDAIRMLERLSGREHMVITGVAVVDERGARVGHAITRVRFRPLERDEIEAYVATGEPMDKAGAYAIQGGAAAFVAVTNGPIDNVIGLPVDTLRRILNQG